MLKSTYSYTKPIITQTDARQHLHDIRCQRQNQLTSVINECHRLHLLHKRIFDNQLNSLPNEKNVTLEAKKSKLKSIPSEPSESVDTFSIQQEVSEYLSESACTFYDNQFIKVYRNQHEKISTPEKNQRRGLSVSPVPTLDKQKNKVYEKWPDYNEISQIVGFRIEKKPTNPIQPNKKTNKKQENKSKRFVEAVKKMQKKSSIQCEIIKNEPTVELPVVNKIIVNIPKKKPQPTLPSILCPSSTYYSKRIQTRQWLYKNCFTCSTVQLI